MSTPYNSVINNKVAAVHAKVSSSLFTSSGMLRATPANVRANRNTLRMSHFTNLKTQIKDPEMLKKTLVEIGVPVTVSDKNDLVVRGHNGETT